ncbi:putative odorant receptor 92a [Aphidius gifuensis]|uniref:putative odorant receptor 92a n=1 Tax=Aphidius gifuensis TaxID=684658 RepID=UPI001CDB4D71|nr:putative odorant receptor 92a [Aphidius gifuensis]
MFTSSSLSTLKNLLPWFQKNLYNDILNFLIDDWSYINNHNNKSRKIMFKYAKIGRAVLIIQLLGAYFTFIPLIGRSIRQSNDGHNNDTITARKVPFIPECWIPVTMPLNLYVGFYIIFCIALFTMCTSFVGSDALFFTIALHICGQFQILYNSMENIRHNQLLVMLKNFEEICNKIIFFAVLGNVFLSCTTGFILLQSFDISQGQIEWSLIARIFLLFVQLFSYSYIGEELTNRAGNIQSVIYNSNWDDLSPKIIKDMAFIIARSQYEFHLTAGKMQNMSIANFKDIVKAIFSYLSVLRLMFQK